MQSDETDRPAWVRWFIRAELALVAAAAAIVLPMLFVVEMSLIGEIIAIFLGYESFLRPEAPGPRLAWYYKTLLGTVASVVILGLLLLHRAAHGRKNAEASLGEGHDGE
jgi:uncharacterized BrkB/YihY/UPF0761 family membrane protein